MLSIRLLPMGKKHALKYRVVIVENKSKITGDPRETIGNWQPLSGSLDVDRDRLNFWLKCGAQPSAKIRSLLNL